MPRKFIVYDTETTGLKRADIDLSLPATPFNRGDEVCQIGGLILNESMEPIYMFCHYCDTVAVECSPGAMEVHGLSMKDIRQYVRCQYLSNVLLEKVPAFFEDDVIFIGYNIEFDQDMVKQTLSNTDVSFNWQPLRSSIMPRTGRWSVDVSEYLKQVNKNQRGYRLRLSSFDAELEPVRLDFYRRYGDMIVDSNCLELFKPSWEKAHNSFYDALNTYLLWRDRIWRKKLI